MEIWVPHGECWASDYHQVSLLVIFFFHFIFVHNFILRRYTFVNFRRLHSPYIQHVHVYFYTRRYTIVYSLLASHCWFYRFMMILSRL